MGSSEEPRVPTSRLLGERKQKILEAWEREVAPLAARHHMSRPALRDHLPALLDRMVERARECEAGVTPSMPHAEPEQHALTRLEQGYSPADIAAEYAALRRCIIHEVGPDTVNPELPAAHELIDQSIVVAVQRAAEAERRILHAVEAVFSAAHRSTTVNELLGRVIDAVLEITSTVDTVAVLLREGDGLRLRAAHGLGRESELGIVVPVGQGFAGRVAAEKKPLLLERAFEDPRVMSPLLHERNVLGLYGVPLCDRDAIIGVATMGSTSVMSFPDEDKLVFRVLSDRAAVAIAQQKLRDELTAARAEAEEAHAELAALLDAVPLGLALLDRDLRYRQVSCALAAWNGAPAAAHRGRSIEEMAPDALAGEQLARRVLETGEAQPPVEMRTSKTGAERIYELMCVPVRTRHELTGVGVVVTDLTYRVRMREALERSEARFHATFDFAAVGIANVGLDGAWLRVNPRYCELLGYTEAELRAMSFQDVTHPDDVDADVAEIEQILRGATTSYTIPKRYVRKDGRVLWVQLTVGLVRDAEGAPEYFVAVAEDIGERRRVTEQLHEAIARREEILAVVSHDLRNPLSTIMLSETVLLRRAEGRVDEEHARRHAQRVLRSAEHMQRIIHDLLDYSSIEAGRLAVTPTALDADVLRDEAVEAVMPVAQERSVHLALVGTRGVRVEGDRQRVLQVLSNLLGNAIKFTPPGGHVTLGVAARERDALFWVEDTGPGIAREELAHIFDRYYQGHTAAERAGAGVGLGLAIARGIVLAHGGTISAESVVGRGTKVCFTLPLAEDAMPSSA